MLLFLLKSSGCLVAFMVFYKLFLEKTSAHVFKRFYLIGVIFISVGIPFLTFTEYVEIQPISSFTITPELYIMPHIEVTESKSIQDYIPTILWCIYVLGVLLFSFRFFKNLYQLIQKIKLNPKFKNENYIHVLLQDLITPHTFFKYIFLNKTKYENNQIPTEVLLHEQTHAKQKHALDILFIEVFQILFWFNPLLYFIKKDIKLNHEFLADRAVINQGANAKNYQQLLLAFSSPDSSYRDARTNQLVNAINYSLIKKRFTVMKTKTSKTVLWLRSLIILPLLAILVYGFSQKVIVEKEVPTTTPSTQQIQTSIGATEAMMTEYKAFIKKFEDSKMIEFSRLNRAIAIYDLMTDAQRATVKKYPETYHSNISEVTSKTPTESDFNSWKNKEKFAIWIDGKFVDNKVLNNYSASDFKYYTSSFVYNNARSEKFPQRYQNHLYTEKGFEETYLKANVTNYNSLVNHYIKAENEFINSGESDDSELRILKAQLDKVYKSLSKGEIDKYNVEKISFANELGLQQKDYKPIRILINSKGQLLVDDNLCKIENLKSSLQKLSTEESKISRVEIITDIDTPKEVISKVKNTLRELGILKVSLNNVNRGNSTQQKVTLKEITEYNKIAKGISSQEKGEQIIKLKDLERLKYLYNLMNAEQKKNAEPFPEIAPMPPPQPAPSKPELNETKNKSNGPKVDEINLVQTRKVKLLKDWFITIDGKKYYYPNPTNHKYYDKDGNEVELDIVKEYMKKNVLYEKLRNEGSNYIFKTDNEKKEIDNLFSDLGGMYFRMYTSEKGQVKSPVNPNFPYYIKLTKENGEEYYKKRSELTLEDKQLLPTPPPPPTKIKKDKVSDIPPPPTSSQQKVNQEVVLQEKKYSKYLNEVDKYNKIMDKPGGYYTKEETERDLKQFNKTKKLYEVYEKTCIKNNIQPKPEIEIMEIIEIVPNMSN